jgi:hypothetical protein
VGARNALAGGGFPKVMDEESVSVRAIPCGLWGSAVGADHQSGISRESTDQTGTGKKVVMRHQDDDVSLFPDPTPTETLAHVLGLPVDEFVEVFGAGWKSARSRAMTSTLTRQVSETSSGRGSWRGTRSN